MEWGLLREVWGLKSRLENMALYDGGIEHSPPSLLDDAKNHTIKSSVSMNKGWRMSHHFKWKHFITLQKLSHSELQKKWSEQSQRETTFPAASRSLDLIKYETHLEKTCLCHMGTTTAQISLCIRTVWSAPLLFAAYGIILGLDVG